MNINISAADLPVSLLNGTIFGYARATKALIPGGRPDFVDVLSGFDYDAPQDAETEKAQAFLAYALMNREFLQAKEAEFLRLHAANGLLLPSMDKYFEETYLDKATDDAIENVTQRYEEYKAVVLENEKEYIWDEAHRIDLAQQIMYFFDSLEQVVKSGILSEEEFVTVVSSAQSEEFFDRILEFAIESESFDVSNVRTTADEVVAYCKTIEVTPDQLDQVIGNIEPFAGTDSGE